MIQFDEHIFQGGWNHQLVVYFLSGGVWVSQNKGKSKGWKQKEEDTAAPTPYL